MTALARAAIRRLRGGVVPQWELGSLSVGYASSAATLRDAVGKLHSTGRVAPIFVRGEWGSGKSHYLAYARSVASAAGIPSARVDLNARSAALSHPQRCYHTMMESIHAATGTGLRAILLDILRSKVARERLFGFAQTRAAGDLAAPLLALCALAAAGDEFGLLDDFRWNVLLGSDLAWADYAYKREQALARLATLGNMFAAVGMGGLVIVLDEAETIDQLTNVRSRMSAYSVIGRLSQLTSVWCLFGITERFDRVVRGDLARGAVHYQFTNESASWFLQQWDGTRLQCITPPAFDVRNAKGLAGVITNLYGQAYSIELPVESTVDKWLAEWAASPARNPRRLIRLLIHRLDLSPRLDT